MSLTIGTGPFGPRRAATLNFDPPERVVIVEPLGRRVRAIRQGETVIDSDAVMLVHESGRLPRYAIPAQDVCVASEPHPDVAGHVTVAWGAVDAWFEEDERMLVHPKDPYPRIESFATSRLVEVRLDGATIARSTRVTALYETGLPIRYYFPRADVAMPMLAPSETVTQCAYKGTAVHWSASLPSGVVPDVAWSYDDEARGEGEAVRWRIAFYNERVDLFVDGAKLERPQTNWSR